MNKQLNGVQLAGKLNSCSHMIIMIVCATECLIHNYNYVTITYLLRYLLTYLQVLDRMSQEEMVRWYDSQSGDGVKTCDV